MEMVSGEEFARRIASFRGKNLTWTEASWVGKPFECASGERHDFLPFEVEHPQRTPIICCEMLGLRLVVLCPAGQAVTCVKLKGLINLRIRSEFGATELPEQGA